MEDREVWFLAIRFDNRFQQNWSICLDLYQILYAYGLNKIAISQTGSELESWNFDWM